MAATAAPAARLGWAQVIAWRAARHHLVERAPAKAMLEVVADIAGLHAQVMSSAELTLATRVDDLAPDAVRHALWEERSLVKTWAMRGTLHLLPAAELPMWQAALSTRRLWESGAWQRGFGVTLAELERLNQAVAQALDGQLLTREELAARVGELTGSPALGDKLRESWGALLKPAAALGLLCFAPSKGQQVRFTSPGSWLGGWAARDPEEAMDEVTRRFLAASGPVTREDFARWWGIPSPARGRGCWSALATRWPGSRSTARPPTPWPPTCDVPGWPPPVGRARSGCCPPSTSTWSPPPARPSTCCRGRSRPASTGPRAGCRRCCWSGAAWRASGARRSRAGASR